MCLSSTWSSYQSPAHRLLLYMQICDSLGVCAFLSFGLDKIQIFLRGESIIKPSNYGRTSMKNMHIPEAGNGTGSCVQT